MKLYHGSPKKLKVLNPKKAKGLDEFENQKAIFLVNDFDYAARYAIGKTLKGKTSFGVGQKKLIIVGNLKPKEGYVYEVELDKNNLSKGKAEQYSYSKQIKNFKITKIYPKNYEKDIIYVKDVEKLRKRLGIKEVITK